MNEGWEKLYRGLAAKYELGEKILTIIKEECAPDISGASDRQGLWHLSAIRRAVHHEGGQLRGLIRSLAPIHDEEFIASIIIECERVVFV